MSKLFRILLLLILPAVIFSCIDSGTSSTPEILGTDPVDGSDNVALDQSLTMMFDSEIEPGSGKVTIYRYDDDSIFEILNPSEAYIELNRAARLKPREEFEPQTKYYVLADEDCFKSKTNGNSFPGITEKDVWTFTTVEANAETNLLTAHISGDINLEFQAVTSMITYNSYKQGEFYIITITGLMYYEGDEYTLSIRYNDFGGSEEYPLSLNATSLSVADAGETYGMANTGTVKLSVKNNERITGSFNFHAIDNEKNKSVVINGSFRILL